MHHQLDDKEVIERFRKCNPVENKFLDADLKHALALLKNGQNVSATRLFRDQKKLGLKSAKNAVEDLLASMFVKKSEMH